MTAPRILIVDDDVALLQALPDALRLRMNGVIAETADSGPAALDRIAATDYDAVVCDIKMPGMDGLGLLARIRALRPDTPTLLITGHGEHDLAVQALRGGAYDFIQKPIDREYFVASLNRAIQMGQLSRRVKELDQLKAQFFTNVSHELRTPLALVLGPIQRLLETGGLTEGQRHDLEVVERNAHTLLKRVNDLLDVSKLEAGKMGLHFAQVDLARVVRLTAAHFEVFAQEHQISFSVETPVSVPAQADPEKLQRVFLNLLSNAFKFVSRGGRVLCELREERGRAIVAVQDNGPGVRPELREAIFQRFRQGDPESARYFGGTGLGLSIAKEFVELHGGTITVSDAPGGGAVFTVALPLTAPSGVQVSTRGPEPDGGKAIAGQAVEELRQRHLANIDANRGRTEVPRREWEEPSPPARTAGAMQETGQALVLVIEDNAEMNRFITGTLAGEYRTATAADGQEGLEKALALHPDLILSDVMMPRMGGEQLVREVRAHSELDGIPVVLLTAKADDELRVRLLREGAQDYLLKPFSAAELRARVGNLVAMKRAREVLQKELASQSHDVAALARDLTVRQRQLQTALNEKEVLLKELHHRVKNNLQVISSLLNLQTASIKNRQARKLFAESQSRIKAMALVHETLYHAKDLAKINFGEYTRCLVTHLFRSYAASADAIRVKIRVDDIALGVDQAIPCGLIINELISNSLKHAFPAGRKGEIRIDFHSAAGSNYELIIGDTGVGFPRGFDFRKAESAGLQLLCTLIDQLGGAIEDRKGSGVQFRIRFPGVAA